jgi:hypothetical protein
MIEDASPPTPEATEAAAPGAEAVPAPGPIAPPTTPGLVRIRRPASWPVTLGVWAIVLGIAWAIFSILDVLLWVYTAAVLPGATDQGPANALTDPWKAAAVLKIALDLAIAVGTVDAGVSMVGRRRRGARLLVRWSLARAAVLVVSLTVAATFWEIRLVELPWRGFGDWRIGINALFGLAFPLIALWWLSRSKVRAQVASFR